MKSSRLPHFLIMQILCKVVPVLSAMQQQKCVILTSFSMNPVTSLGFSQSCYVIEFTLVETDVYIWNFYFALSVEIS